MKPKKPSGWASRTWARSLMAALAAWVMSAAAADQVLTSQDYAHLALKGGSFTREIVTSGDWMAARLQGDIQDVTSGPQVDRLIFWRRIDGNWSLRQVIPLNEHTSAAPRGTTLVMANDHLLVSSPAQGRVYAYRLQGTGWVADGELISGTNPGSSYGADLILTQDRAFVGSPAESGGAGAVHIFQRGTTGWTIMTRLTAPTPQTGGFGASLFLHEDQLYIGAPDQGEGRVVVFQNTDPVWTWQKDINPPVTSVQFGNDVQVSGGFLFIGEQTSIIEYQIAPEGLFWNARTRVPAGARFHVHQSILRVCAPSNQLGPPRLHKEITFYKRSSTLPWVVDTVLDTTTLGLQALDAVTWSGDELLLGGLAAVELGMESDRALVKILRKEAAGWAVQHTLSTLSYQQAKRALFGRTVAGYTDWVVVGMPGDNCEGAAAVYRHAADGTFTFHSLLQPPADGSVSTVSFGALVGVYEDRIVVGNKVDRVHTFVYDAATDSWKHEAAFPRPAGATAAYGSSIEMSGDLLNIASVDLRQVAIHHYTASGGWQQEALLTSPHPNPAIAASQRFGQSITNGGGGGQLFVGAPDVKFSAIYMYDRGDARTWNHVATITPPAQVAGEEWGRLIEMIGGSHLIVGTTKNLRYYARNGEKWIPGKVILPLGAGSDFQHISMSYYSSFISGPSGVRAFHNNDKWLWTPLLNPLIPADFPALSQGRVDDQIFLGKDTAGSPTRGEVHVFQTRQVPLLTVEGNVTPVSQNPGTVVLDGGEHLVGADIKRFLTLTLTQRGSVNGPYFITGRVESSGTPDLMGYPGVPGSDNAELFATKSALNVLPNQKDSVEISFRPRIAGEKRLVFDLFNHSPSVPPLPRYEVLVRVVQTASPMQTTEPLVSGIFRADQFPGLHARVSGTLPWSFRWFKNGRVIPGATQASLMPKDGGTYRYEVTNSRGTLGSGLAPVGLYTVPSPDVVARPGTSARLAVTVSGPDLKVRWAQGDQLLQDGAEFSGTQTPVLTVKNVIQDQVYKAVLTLDPAGPDFWQTEVPVHLHAEQPPALLNLPGADLRFFLGQDNQHAFEIDYTGPVLSPPVFTFRGLPRAIQGQPAGSISGIPALAGIYTIQVTVTVDGLSATRSFRLAVTPPVQPIAGIFWGWLPRSQDLPAGGVMILDLQASAAFSASILHGSTRGSLAGVISEGYTSTTAARPFPVQLGGVPHLCWIESRTEQVLLNLRVRPASAPADAPATLLSELKLIKPHASQQSFASIGTYNFGLIGRETSPGEVQGHGFGSFKVDSERRVTYTAQLADGSTLTGSTWLSDPSIVQGESERLYLYQANSKTRTLLQGSPRLTSSVESDLIVQWERPRIPGRLYPDGFAPDDLVLNTSRYTPPGNTPIFPGEELFNVELDAQDMSRVNIPFSLNGKNQITLGSQEANPNQGRLALAPATGLFSGQFTLRDPDPANSARTITRTVPYRGILLPDLHVGVGWFHLPGLANPAADPPTTLATSPIVSGSVLIEPTEAAAP